MDYDTFQPELEGKIELYKTFSSSLQKNIGETFSTFSTDNTGNHMAYLLEDGGDGRDNLRTLLEQATETTIDTISASGEWADAGDEIQVLVAQALGASYKQMKEVVEQNPDAYLDAKGVGNMMDNVGRATGGAMYRSIIAKFEELDTDDLAKGLTYLGARFDVLSQIESKIPTLDTYVAIENDRNLQYAFNRQMATIRDTETKDEITQKRVDAANSIIEDRF